METFLRGEGRFDNLKLLTSSEVELMETLQVPLIWTFEPSALLTSSEVELMETLFFLLSFAGSFNF